MFGPHWYYHSRGAARLVFVTSYVREADGRTSNWVCFRKINANGVVTDIVGGDYGGKKFRPAHNYRVRVEEVTT
jgi:hypothetical protein